MSVFHRYRQSLSHAVEQLESRRVLAVDMVPLADINPAPSNTEAFEFAEVGPVTFFVGSTNTASGLWKTDGTEAGTALVYEFSSVGYGNRPERLTNVNGTLFFTASEGTGVELWKSDGTAAGTVLVKDINVGSAGSYPLELTNVAGTLFFSAEIPTRGAELWKSDGTSAGTVLVRDLVGGTGSSSPSFLTAVNSTLFFVGRALPTVPNYSKAMVHQRVPLPCAISYRVLTLLRPLI